MTSTTPTVLFICVKNAGKSQMAAALMRAHAGHSVTVHSAGTQPGEALNAESVAALHERGASVAGEHPKAIDPDVLRTADRVIVLGDAAHVQPIPGMRARIERWLTTEPSHEGIHGAQRMRMVCADIEERVQQLTRELSA